MPQTSGLVPASLIRKNNIIRIHNQGVGVLSTHRVDGGRIKIRYAHRTGQDSIEVRESDSVYRFATRRA